MILNITQKHIQDGRPGLGEKCPAALAFLEQAERSCYVGISCVVAQPFEKPSYGPFCMHCGCPLARHIAYIPAQLRQWIQRFDEFGKDAVSAITVELDLLEKGE